MGVLLSRLRSTPSPETASEKLTSTKTCLSLTNTSDPSTTLTNDEETSNEASSTISPFHLRLSQTIASRIVSLFQRQSDPVSSTMITGKSTENDDEGEALTFYRSFFLGTPAHGPTFDEITQSWSDHQINRLHNFIQTLFPLPEASCYHKAPSVDEAVFLAFRAPDMQGQHLRIQLRRALARMLRYYGWSLEYGSSFHPQAPTQPLETILRNSNVSGGSLALADTSLDNQPYNQDLWDSQSVTGAALPFEVRYPAVRLYPLPLFDLKVQSWISRHSHNHLRLTRILRSLRVLGCSAEAEVLYETLLQTLDDMESYHRVPERAVWFWSHAARSPLHFAPRDFDTAVASAAAAASASASAFGPGSDSEMAGETVQPSGPDWLRRYAESA